MALLNPTLFQSEPELRAWLEANHGRAAELWVGFHKVASGKGGITYQQALDEALCFGWIDGVRKGIDDASYTIRFSPRKPGSVWSLVNIKRAGELIRLGSMQPPGLTAFNARDEAKSQQYSYEARSRGLQPPYEETFRQDAQAWEFFQAQPPGYRRTVSWWVMSAKREDTRRKRLATLMEESRQQRRLPLLTPPRARK